MNLQIDKWVDLSFSGSLLMCIAFMLLPAHQRGVTLNIRNLLENEAGDILYICYCLTIPLKDQNHQCISSSLSAFQHSIPCPWSKVKKKQVMDTSFFLKKKPLWFPKTAGHCTFQQTLLKHKKIMHLGQFQARIWCTAEYLLDDVCGIDSGKLHHWCV